MWFSTFLCRNIARHPVRSLLAVVAIGLAVGSVEALDHIAAGFARMLLRQEPDQVEIVVVRAGGGRRHLLSEELGPKIEKISGVKHVLPSLTETLDGANFGINQVLINGFIPTTFAFKHMTILAGQSLQESDTRAVIIGTLLAEILEKQVGDKIEILGQDFDNVGIYQAHNASENSGVVMPLKCLQKLSAREGLVTSFSLILDRPNDHALVEKVRREVEKLRPNIVALAVLDNIESKPRIDLAKSMAWITSAIALVIGFFGILNTMVMSVSERTREIGILRAVGWKVSRVIRMVLIESVFLSILGALAGTLGAIGLLRLLTRMPRINGIIDGKIDLRLVAYGFLIAIGVGLLAGLFPANRAARMLPTEALRHE